MTTTITVQSHNYPARVRTVDRWEGNVRADDLVLRPEDGVRTFHCTTTRTIEVVDLEYGEKIAEHEKRLAFGAAVEALKAGQRVARAGWNGKGMFLFLVNGSRFKVNREPLLSILGEGTEVDYHAHIDLKTAQGYVVPWQPSQADVLSNDWQIVSAVG
jgi:hypothetical protein